MPHSSPQPDDRHPKTVNVRGRRRPYLERRAVRRRDYYLLDHIGSPLRSRYLAFDPDQGPGGSFFLVQTWPNGPLAKQQLRVLSGMKHDSLPRVVDWQPRGKTVDVVLTWIDGIPLDKYLENIRRERRPWLDPSQAIRLIHGLANAVCQLNHGKQIAHGDIQPANVIVTSHPSRLVLIDFGSAWVVQDTAGREEGDGLNRCYAAPELSLNEDPVGFFADQFSVSVLLYQLLTQQLPYAGMGGKAGHPGHIEQARDSLAPPSKASAACQKLPKALRDAVDRVTIRGLALAPEDRYRDRHEWLDDLFQTTARFRLKPELPPNEDALTRVIRWFVKPRAGK